MSNNRILDVIIYGATGFTGKEVLKYLLKQLNPTTSLTTTVIDKSRFLKYKFAIAGRSEEKLNKLREELNLNNFDIPSYVADCTDETSLNNLFIKTKLVLNCTGPYRFLGENIVKSCLACKTHYLDICGEPQFMENMFLKYHTDAINSKVLILHACAFDSVPADLGFLYTMRLFDNIESCNTIESYLSLYTNNEEGLLNAGHYTTYECAVHGLGDVGNLKYIRNSINEKYKLPYITYNGTKLEKLTMAQYDDRVKQFIIPFMGADASVVRSTARSRSLVDIEHIKNNSFLWPQYNPYVCIGDSIYNVANVSIFGGMFSLLSSFEYGRSILLAHPDIFSAGMFTHKGPSQKQLDTTSFIMQFIANGYKENKETGMLNDITITTSVEGPEPGYVATPIIFIEVALTLLDEYNKINSKGVRCIPEGGVYTPGAVFYDSESIYNNLNNVGIKFKVIE